MESIFGPDYSQFYDLLYKDKNYESEVNYIEGLVKKYMQDARTILDLGCGTGCHASILRSKGYTIHGVDRSEEMIQVAKSKNPKIDFTQGDIRSIRLGKKFEVVISLFHVMCYQTSNDDLENAFKTAYDHLNFGGLFVFDTWYGPAVLTDRPTNRVKMLANEQFELVRIAEPSILENEDIVRVNYHLTVKDKLNGSLKELEETHQIRYLFKPEVNYMFSKAGFDLLDVLEFGTGNEPSFRTWNVCYVGRKI